MKKKYLYLNCSVYDVARIRERLQAMAQRGWRLDSGGPGPTFWRFQEAPPASVRYEVTYIPSLSVYDTAFRSPTAEEAILEDLCTGTGWQRVSAFGQMHIYCNGNPDAPPLETDGFAQVQSIRRAMGRHFYPKHLLLTAFFLLQLLLTRHSPALMVVCGMMAAAYGADLLGSWVWLGRAEAAAMGGRPIPQMGFEPLVRLLRWAGLLVWLALGPKTIFFALVAAPILLQTCHYVFKFMTARNAPKWLAYLLALVAISIVLALLLAVFLIKEVSP